MKYTFAAGFRIVSYCLAFVIAGCGGGGSSSGGGVVAPSPPSPPPPPVSLSMNSGATVVPVGSSVILTWVTANASSCTASGDWSGAQPTKGSKTIAQLPRDMTFTLDCSGPAGATSAKATVTTVVTTASAAPTASHVVSDSGRTSLDYFALPIFVQTMVWDSSHARIHIATTPDSPSWPNMLISLDPATQQVTAKRPLLQQGWLTLALSFDRQFLYIGYGDNALQSVSAGDLQSRWVVPVGSGRAAVSAVIPSPTSSRTVAVLGSSDGTQQLQILDDGIPRPNDWAYLVKKLNLFVSDMYDMRWAEDESALYISTGWGSIAVGVTQNGLDSFAAGAFGGGGRQIGRRLFTTGGRVLNLDNLQQLAGRFPDVPRATPNGDELAASGKAFSGRVHLIDGGYVNGFEVSSYDLDHYGFIDNIVFNGAATIAYPGGMIMTWGDAGLAIGGSKGLVVAQGSFAAKDGAAPAALDVATIGQGITTSGTDSEILGTLKVGVSNLYASDIAADRCGNLYASVKGKALFQANNVLRLDPDTLGFRGSTWAGSEPLFMEVSDDCSALYVALRGANSIARLAIPAMVRETEVPLGQTDGRIPEFAMSMSVAPSRPKTVAVVTSNDPSGCSVGRSVVVFDDTKERPVRYAPPIPSPINTLTWGQDATTLYGTDYQHGYSLAVDASGAHTPTVLFDRPLAFPFVLMPHDFQYVAVTKQLIDPLGNVVDTRTKGSLKRLSLPEAGVTGCGLPMQAQVADPTTGRIFFAQRIIPNSFVDDAQLVIKSFDPATLQRIQIARIRMLDLGLLPLSYPTRLVRTGGDGLALVTDAGQVVTLKGAMLMP